MIVVLMKREDMYGYQPWYTISKKIHTFLRVWILVFYTDFQLKTLIQKIKVFIVRTL